MNWKRPDLFLLKYFFPKNLLNTFSTLTYIVLGSLTITTFALFAVLSAPVLFFCRSVATLLSKRLTSDLNDILNGLSACFASDLFSGQPPRANIVVNITVKRNVSKGYYRSIIQRNWIEATDQSTGKLKFARLQQYPSEWFGFFFYKTCTKFCIDNHFFFHENLGKGEETTEDDATEFTEILLNSPFRPEQSPWEVHVIQKYRNEKTYPGKELSLLIIKIHHSLADGYSILRLIVEGLFGRPISMSELPTPRYPKRSGWQLLKYWLSMPFATASGGCFMGSLVFRQSSWKVPDKRKKWHQIVQKSNSIQIQKIKDIKNSFGVSFTSVLQSAVSSAIQKNLERRESGELNSRDLENFISCFSVLPLPRKDWSLGNHATGTVFQVPTSHSGDVVERLVSMNRLMEDRKDSMIPYLVRFYFGVCGAHFSKVTSWFMRRNFISTGLTNFPSVPQNISDRNGNVQSLGVDFTVGGLEGETGVTISILSYNQAIVASVSAEKTLMTRSELSEFINDFSHEIESLFALSKAKS